MGTPVTGKNGTIKIDQSGVLTTVADATQVQLQENLQVLTAEMAFGETAAPKQVTGEDLTGSVTFRYTTAGYAAIRAAYKAQAALTLEAVPIAGAGNNVMTGEVYISSLGTPYSAGGIVMCSFNFVNADGDGLSLTPQIAVAPTGDLTGTAGAAFSQAFTGSGGTGPYVYTMTGKLPGCTLSNGTLSGTITSGATGAYIIRITATDNNGAAGTREYTVTVS